MSHPPERYLSIDDLRLAAKRRLPHFVWEFLEGGTGRDLALSGNRAAFNRITMCPRYSRRQIAPNLETTILGQYFNVPFGVAPIGTAGLVWPGAERILARAAARNGMLFCQSMVGCETPETVGSLADGCGWFQIYPPFDRTMLDDLLRRVGAAGFAGLVVTVDVPTYGRRERPRRAGMRSDASLSPRMALQALLKPRWLAETLRNGPPKYRTLDAYFEGATSAEVADVVLTKLHDCVDADYLRFIRERWPGPLILKGIQHPDDARFAVAQGVDGIIVSNHGGRQLDNAIASIDALPAVAEAVGGEAVIMLDSGVCSGADIVAAISRGADFVLLGRAFAYGVAALGADGGDHVCHILRDEMTNIMMQLGAHTLDELRQYDETRPVDTASYPQLAL